MNTAFSHRIDPEPPEDDDEDEPFDGGGIAREREAALHWVAVFQAAHHPEAVASRFLTGSTFPDGTPDPWFDQLAEDNAIYEHRLGMELRAR